MYNAICALWDIDLEQALAWKSTDTKVVVAVEKEFPMATITAPLSWRQHLQRFGTEMGRGVFGPDFWVEQFADRYLAYEEHMPDNTLYVVRDVRFNNEAELITDYAGDIWQVHRPGYEGDEHVSEAGINPNYIRGDIGNDGTIEELHTLLSDWMLAAYGLRNTVSSG